MIDYSKTQDTFNALQKQFHFLENSTIIHAMKTFKK
jgi:hypothetical protein